MPHKRKAWLAKRVKLNGKWTSQPAESVKHISQRTRNSSRSSGMAKASGRGYILRTRRLPPLQQQNKAILGFILIANDQPLAVREWLPAFAQWLNAPPPPQISVENALKASGRIRFITGLRCEVY